MSEEPDLERAQLGVARASLYVAVLTGLVSVVALFATFVAPGKVGAPQAPEGGEILSTTQPPAPIAVRESMLRTEPLSADNGPSIFDDALVGLPLVKQAPLTGRWFRRICPGDVIVLIDGALPPAGAEDLVARVEGAEEIRVRPQGHLDDLPSSSEKVTAVSEALRC